MNIKVLDRWKIRSHEK